MERKIRGRRILPIVTVGMILLTVISCGRRRSLMDSISADDEYLTAVAELEQGERPKGVNSPREGKREKATIKRSDAVMTPFDFESVNDTSWVAIFNDSNKYQYPYAEKFGINPIHSLGDAYYTSRPIEYVSANGNFDIDTLTHSIPFLVPEAHRLLNDIGADFIEKLKRKGVTGWRMRVTSLLRTPGSVKKLRKVNINAADSSTHKFATTFDLSYLHFRPGANATPTSDDLLKQTLAETLFDFRKKERCMVKYEVKTHCFHITVTE